MNLKHAVLGGLALIASSATYAANVDVDLGVATLTYDDASVFGTTFAPSPGAGTITLVWTNSDIGAVAFPGPVILPSFTVTAKTGFQLGAPVSLAIGDMGFVDAEGTVSSVTLDGALGVNGVGIPITGVPLAKNTTAFSLNVGPIDPGVPVASLFMQGTLSLSETGTGAVVLEPVSFSVTFGVAEVPPAPVPVPGAVWLLGSGLVGLAARRRKAA